MSFRKSLVRFSSRISMARLTLLALLLIASGVVDFRIRADQEIFLDSTKTMNDPFQTPVRIIEDRLVAQSNVVAILLHGFRCSASMMVPMARALAMHGIRSYIPDLPGHGHAVTSFSIPCARFSKGTCHPFFPGTEYSAPIVEEIIREEHLENAQVVLIGHSWGGMLASTYPAFSKVNIKSRISLEGPRPRDDQEHNLLYLGNSNFPFVTQTSGALILPGSQGGDPRLNTAYRFLAVDNEASHFGHLNRIVNSAVIETILKWLQFTTDWRGDPATEVEFNIFIIRSFLAAVVLLVLIQILPTTGKFESEVPWNNLWGYAALLTGLIISVWIEKSYSSSFSYFAKICYFRFGKIFPLICSGLLGFAALIARQGSLRDFFPSVKQMVMAVLTFGFMYLALLEPIDRNFHYTAISGPRIASFLIYTLSLYPFCWCLRRLTPMPRTALLRFASLATIWVCLASSLGYFLNEETDLFILLFVSAELFATFLEYSTRSSATATVLASLLGGYYAAILNPF